LCSSVIGPSIFFQSTPNGGLREHVVELVGVELVVGQRVAQLDAADVLALDEHVRLADGVALGVQLLTMQRHGDLLAELD
jgi:hypothetical protein